ncbi:hypothetical protein EDC04DRAFT_2694684 [Pisolithus marmoratus]|nr:hypothetical protein EDC04DRAFT_2694684 [Pisolithus marmoratus]
MLSQAVAIYVPLDLNEAIMLHIYVLQLHPAGHASHPLYLHHLTLCLIERFHDKAIVDDLDEAISLEQNALELSAPGDPSYNASKESLATYTLEHWGQKPMFSK